MIEALLDSGKFEVISLGGAVQHPDYSPIQTDKYGPLWTIFPIDAYGDKMSIRAVIQQHKPDMMWFMTDPRFYDWLWQIDDEIRPNIPMVYYHVWDNFPIPTFNDRWYCSNDYIATISKVTSEIVQSVAPKVKEKYIPHAVDSRIFQKLTDPETVEKMKTMKEQYGLSTKTVFFWNNRNARRKQSGTLIFWFKKFLDKVGHDKAVLLMHTDLDDPHGQPLNYLTEHLGLTDGQVIFSTEKLPPEYMAQMYNIADCTVNISDAEGFGLSTLESLACQTPIIVSMTGGLQEQVTNGKEWFGIGIEPASKAIIGSQQVPWIYEDRISEEDFLNAMETMFNMSKKERAALGKKGFEHVNKNYNFKDYQETWVKTMVEIHDEFGSWETRKGYTQWECVEL
tara:strand:- start:762 stop:1946 length:1185 start_codon:yes stop_codon:yes gene_type:complete